MAPAQKRRPMHQLAAYAKLNGLAPQNECARIFHIPLGVYKQLVSGNGRAAYARMETWENISDGEVSAQKAWAWQRKYAPLPQPTPKPRAKKRRA